MSDDIIVSKYICDVVWVMASKYMCDFVWEMDSKYMCDVVWEKQNSPAVPCLLKLSPKGSV